MTTANNDPIGIFDSGIGGLSVLTHIQQYLPHEQFIYVADTAHLPYGNRSTDYIIERAQRITEWFMRMPIKALVIACNTATAAAGHHLRQQFEIPIFGIEPAVKPAVALTKTRTIGVMATAQTLLSEKYQHLIQTHGHNTRILSQACPGLVEQVEAGEFDNAKTQALVQQYIEPLKQNNADVIVLGCTHYPFLKPLIAQYAGPKIQLLDTGAPVAKHLSSRLEQLNLCRLTGQLPQKMPTSFFTSTVPAHLQTHIARLWPDLFTLQQLPIDVS